MRALQFAAAAAVLLAAAGALAKQTDPAPASKAAPANTVSGVSVPAPQKQDPLVDPAVQFVRSHLPTNRNAQYARFHDPVCVNVQGLPEEFDAFVAQRVVEMAKTVKAPVDPSPACKPNVNVIFSTQPQAQLGDIAKRRDILFGFYFKASFDKIRTFSRPIQSWYLTRAVGTNGRDMLELYDPVPCVSSPFGICDIKSPAVKGRAGSRLGNDMSTEIVHSLIIADANKVTGEKIDAVADYIAVLALSRWQGLERCNTVSTILNLMADDCGDPPEAATASDIGLLTGLYAMSPRDLGDLQRMSIASRMRAADKAQQESSR